MGKDNVLRKDLELKVNEINKSSELINIKVKKHRNAVSVIVCNRLKQSEQEFIGNIQECFIFLRGVGTLL